MEKPDSRGAWALLCTDDLGTDRNLFHVMRLLRKQHYGWRRHFLRVEEIRYVKVS